MEKTINQKEAARKAVKRVINRCIEEIKAANKIIEDERREM